MAMNAFNAFNGALKLHMDADAFSAMLALANEATKSLPAIKASLLNERARGTLTASAPRIS
jgi:hypothetical protein